MPDPSNPLDTRWGLALSGGGYRATLYHCGALIRMNELGILPKLDRITSVSGGSITSGRLAVAWDRLDFDDQGRARRLIPEVIEPLRSFSRKNLDVGATLSQLIPFGKTAAEKLISAYDALFDGVMLDQLPERPHFIFMSTNLQTGRSIRFSRRRVADYRVGEIKDVGIFSLAQAVGASSAFPPVLSPVILPVKSDSWSELEGADLFGDAAYDRSLNLTDGGVYDNLGLNRIDHFGTILCSDAGAPFSIGATFKAFSPKQVLRALDIATDQARALRKARLFDLAERGGQNVCYWGIDQAKTDQPPHGVLLHDPAVTRGLARMRTRLNRFSEPEQAMLINWGYASSDERIRRYVLKGSLPPQELPEPNWPLVEG